MMAFTAPSLLLKNINIVELMPQQLKASAAELRQPLIILNDQTKATSQAPGTTDPSWLLTKMALFYRTLHPSAN